MIQPKKLIEMQVISQVKSDLLDRLVLLEDRAVIVIQGQDSTDFLQRIITQNIKSQENRSKIFYSLILSPQGKILYDFFLYQEYVPDIEDQWLLECDDHFVEEIIYFLTKYKLRSKISIKLEQDYKIVILLDQNLNPELDLIFHHDPRHDLLPRRMIIKDDNNLTRLKDNIKVNKQGIEQYRELHYQLKLPRFRYDFLPNEYFPFDLGLHHFNSISVNKGCYIGQEVITRTFTRGVIRKAVYGLKSTLKSLNYTHGLEIFEEDLDTDNSKPALNNLTHETEESKLGLVQRPVGKILGCYGANKYLAVLREIGVKKNFYLASGQELVLDQ